MKNKKRNAIVTCIIIGFILLVGVVFFLLNNSVTDTGLSVLEKKWISDHVNQVVDVHVYNDVPVYGYNGSGISFDYLDYFTDIYQVSFNKISYYTSTKLDRMDFGFMVLSSDEKVTDNDILLDTDYYAVMGKDKNQHLSLGDIDKVGVLNNDYDMLKKYFSNHVEIVKYKDFDSLMEGIKNQEVSYVCSPVKQYMDQILSNQLSSVVHEFVSSQQPPNEEEKKEDDEIKTENIEKIEKFNAEEHKNFKEKTINCKKLEPTELSGQEIKIVVANPVTVEGGMFGKSYIKYEVTTEPFKWTVERRYSDFDALRKLLQKYYPSFYVPPLPLKKIGNKRFTESFINKRMKFLNQFINNVIASESFKCAEFLYAFLSYTDRGKFESKFKEYQTRTPSPYVEEYKTLDGIISISLDEKNERYFKNTNKYFNLQANILEKVNYNLKTLNHNMKIVCELVKVIQKNFEVLHVLNTRVMMKPTITKAYEEISCFFKNWGNILTKQRLLIKDHIKDFFKYITSSRIGEIS